MCAGVDGEIAAGHKYQLFDARRQARQDGNRLRALQCQKPVFGHGDHVAAAANFGLDMGDVVDFARTVNNDKYLVVALVEEHQVIHDGAVFGQQQAVALFAHCQVDHVHRHQGFKRGSGVWAYQAQLAHVGHVKQTSGFARVQVFGHQAHGVLHRHGVTGKGHHACIQFDMQRVERRGQQRGGHGISRSGHGQSPDGWGQWAIQGSSNIAKALGWFAPAVRFT